MKKRSYIVGSIALLIAVLSVGVYAAQDAKSSERAKKEECFKLHAKLMSKPALMNINNCWHAHAYMMDR